MIFQPTKKREKVIMCTINYFSSQQVKSWICLYQALISHKLTDELKKNV